MRLRHVIDTESKTGKPFALLVERCAHAVRCIARARRRHQFKRRVFKHENRRCRAITLRAPLRRTAEQRLAAGDTSLDVANKKNGVIESCNHGRGILIKRPHITTAHGEKQPFWRAAWLR